MFDFRNRVALITGAGQGIGKELARQLAEAGAAIGAIDLDATALEKLTAELSAKSVATAVADVGDRSLLFQAAKEIEQKLGPTDLLFANAGIGRETRALNFKSADIEAHLRVNLIGVANSIEAVLPNMIARKTGHIVGLSSVASFHGIPGMAGYCASKAGLNAMLDSIRVELKPLGVRVTTVCPSWIRTAMTEQVTFPMPHLLEVDDAVRRILTAVAAGRPFFAFPRQSVRMLRVLRWLPTPWADWLVERQLRELKKK
jgi:NAD(P)-dependent dehydrogenase (short-subunit alcohol dehydrogenase family)